MAAAHVFAHLPIERSAPSEVALCIVQPYVLCNNARLYRIDYILLVLHSVVYAYIRRHSRRSTPYVVRGDLEARLTYQRKHRNIMI